MVREPENLSDQVSENLLLHAPNLVVLVGKENRHCVLPVAIQTYYDTLIYYNL